MCTLALAYRVFADTPIAVAANRDERTDRPAAPPERWGDDGGIVAPRDLEAGGTWIGYNDAGVFAGITNRWTPDDIGSERSRGRLVLDALACEHTADAARAVEDALVAASYEGFNLVLADAAEAVLFEWDGRLRVTSLTPGLHVVTNTVIDDDVVAPDARSDVVDRQADTVARVRGILDPAAFATAADWLDRAGAVLGDPAVGACVHGDGYGTVSSSLIAIATDGSAEYRFANGRPCEAPFELVRADAA